jgi:hypothetical protein
MRFDIYQMTAAKLCRWLMLLLLSLLLLLPRASPTWKLKDPCELMLQAILREPHQFLRQASRFFANYTNSQVGSEIS